MISAKVNTVYLRSQACYGARGQANGGRRADILPASYKPTDPGNAEEIQPREAHHFQHLPVLPQGETSLQLIMTF